MIVDDYCRTEFAAEISGGQVYIHCCQISSEFCKISLSVGNGQSREPNISAHFRYLPGLASESKLTRCCFSCVIFTVIPGVAWGGRIPPLKKNLQFPPKRPANCVLSFFWPGQWITTISRGNFLLTNNKHGKLFSSLIKQSKRCKFVQIRLASGDRLGELMRSGANRNGGAYF